LETVSLQLSLLGCDVEHLVLPEGLVEQPLSLTWLGRLDTRGLMSEDTGPLMSPHPGPRSAMTERSLEVRQIINA
jgi:hypothetical protein